MTDFLVVLNSAAVRSLSLHVKIISSCQHRQLWVQGACSIGIADFDPLEIFHVSWLINSRRKHEYCRGTFRPERGGNRFVEF